MTTKRVELTVDETRAGYDRWAAGYDEAKNPMVAATAWALATWPLAVAGRDVIELGCGTGRHAAPLLAAGAASYLGVDASEGMLARARARTDDARARWCVAELAAVPEPDASRDVALVVLVLEHVHDLAPVCAELARLLRPGGRLRILELHPERIDDGTRAHFRDGDAELWFASVAHPVPTLVAALAAAGLTTVAAREHTADGALLAAVPALGKHAGRLVLLDVEAARAT
ncbi:MAG: class I SAM-dependent methyltransferase [Phycisphaerales bacterium]|nr:class I SAM-dependent methyltransferase [Phycisphaerales bacterium]